MVGSWPAMLSLMAFVMPGSGDWGAGEGSLNVSWSRTDLDDLRVLRESERERPPERNDLSDLLVDRERDVLPIESNRHTCLSVTTLRKVASQKNVRKSSLLLRVPNSPADPSA